MTNLNLDFRGVIQNYKEVELISSSFKIESESIVILDLDSNLDIVFYYSLCLNSNCTIIFILLNNSNLISNIDSFKPNYIITNNEYDLDENWIKDIHKENFIYFNLHNKKNPFQQVLLSTSGSTGSQKFVRLTKENIYFNAKSIVQSLNIRSTDVTITNLPLHYSFGLSVLNSHLLVGAKVIVTNYSIVQKEFWNLVKDHKVTNFFGVPYTFEILDKIRFLKMDLPHLRLIAQAGGKMNIKLQDKYLEYCDEKGIKYFTMYGQTEATARMSYLPYQFANQKKGSIGIPIPSGRFELRNETGQKIEGINSVGELVYFGPNVSLGYATCYNDLLKEDENKGMLFTGDLAKRDDDGFYYIVGRKNRFLKLFGNRISLQEIEEQLESKGIEAVCGGQDDKLITYTTNKNEVDQIRKWLSEFTKIHLSAFEVKFIEKIPRNESGKILYSKLFL